MIPDPNAPLPPVPMVDLTFSSHKQKLDTLMGYLGEDRVVYAGRLGQAKAQFARAAALDLAHWGPVRWRR